MEQFTGHLTRIIYRKDIFVIARFRTRDEGKAKPSQELVLAGPLLPEFTEKDLLAIFGEWEEHPKFGRQFKLESVHQQPPRSIEEYRDYLPGIYGIGTARAKLLIEHFGAGIGDVLDHQPERILEVKGIGPECANRIIESWNENAINREIGFFLAEIGIGKQWATKIRKALGDDAASIIKANPYRLIDVHGKNADSTPISVFFRTDDVFFGTSLAAQHLPPLDVVFKNQQLSSSIEVGRIPLLDSIHRSDPYCVESTIGRLVSIEVKDSLKLTAQDQGGDFEEEILATGPFTGEGKAVFQVNYLAEILRTTSEDNVTVKLGTAGPNKKASALLLTGQTNGAAYVVGAVG